MNIIDTIINLFPTKKIRYQNQFDKVVNLTLPDYVNSTGNTNLAGGGKGTDQNPTGTGGSQGTQIGADGLTVAERNKIRFLKIYNDKLALYKTLKLDYNKKFNEGTETPANMAKLKAALLKLKTEVAVALNGIKTYAEYTAAKINFEAVPEVIGSYKVKTIL
jgi:hypothetical protein